MKRRVAVVGGGVAGIACARALADAGVWVTVFDKGRATGGRVATRRDAVGGFDHGAQFFTARDPDFAALVAGLEARGVVERWAPRVWDGRPGDRSHRVAEPWFVGVPGMRELPRVLAAGLEVRTTERVVGLTRGDGWTLTVDRSAGAAVAPRGEVGPFGRVVVALPAEQVATLPGVPEAGRARAAAVAMEPCLAVMGTFPGVEVGYDVARLAGGAPGGRALSWATREDSKPGRAGSGRWVLHSGAAWAAERIDAEPEAAGAELVEAFAAWVRAAGGRASLDDATWKAHRWRYARVASPGVVEGGDHAEPAWADEEAGFGLCGDWLTASRVEDAWRSGRALAKKLLGGALG